MLHNPRYAGAFAYGRTLRTRRPGGGFKFKRQKPEDWTVLIRDAHPGYIDWDRYEINRNQLKQNAHAYVPQRRSAPREGPALLQGLVICGLCGTRMTVRYHTRRGRQFPDYMCQRDGIETATRICQSIPGTGIDRAIGDLLVELMTPDSLEVALRVQQELVKRADEVDAWRERQVQRAREEADLARQRFMQTHPDNRMVANALEAEWNDRLRALEEARQELETQRNRQSEALGQQQRQRVLELSTDFPCLWRDAATPNRERKRMVRLLIEDVTLTRGDQLDLGIRLRSGVTRQITIAPERVPWITYRTPPAAVAEIDRLLETLTESKIAESLNQRGFRTGYGLMFTCTHVQKARRTFGLTSRFDRLRSRGLLTARELGSRLDISANTIKLWRRQGLLVGHAYNDRPCCLYEIPDNPPVKNAHKAGRRRKHSGSAGIVTCNPSCQ